MRAFASGLAGTPAGSGIALVTLGCFLARAAQAELLTHHDLPYAVALTIAQEAVESCHAKGYAVSAVVVDRDGETVVAIRGDDAAPHTTENARRKAYTALSFRVSTTEYAKRFAEDNPVVRQQVTLPGVIAIPGGLPIKVGEEVIAGVGLGQQPQRGGLAGAGEGEHAQGAGRVGAAGVNEGSLLGAGLQGGLRAHRAAAQDRAACGGRQGGRLG